VMSLHGNAFRAEKPMTYLLTKIKGTLEEDRAAREARLGREDKLAA
jgi:hypothetical protein